MKKGTIFIISAMLLLASCTAYEPETGTVSFKDGSLKAISGEIQYFEITDIFWRLTAVKVSGNNYGHCENLGIDPSSFNGEFATGQWNYTLDGYYQGIKVYTGSITVNIAAGENCIPINVFPCGDTGRLVLHNYETKPTMNASAVKISIDNTLVDIIGIEHGVVNFTFVTQVGIHNIDLVFLEDADNPSNALYLESFKVRIVGGHDTEVTKMADGAIGIAITITHEEAIV